MASIPKQGEVYRHFKGGMYKVEAVGMHTETGERMVIYRSLEDKKVYVRPLEMFISRVDKEKYPDVTQKYRFELQPDESEVMDPYLSQFLDADTYEERLEILVRMRDRIDKEMITTMAIACDMSVPEGDIETQYEAIKDTLLTRERYEGGRLRR